MVSPLKRTSNLGGDRVLLSIPGESIDKRKRFIPLPHAAFLNYLSHIETLTSNGDNVALGKRDLAAAGGHPAIRSVPSKASIAISFFAINFRLLRSF